ncbi:hypothetical protein COP1_028340 [Malus domestica]
MAKRRIEGDIPPTYPGTDRLTLKFICGGQLMISPKHTYFGGKTVYFDNVDPDLLSTIELKYMMEEVGYTNVKKYHYTKLGEEPEHGLHPLVSDNDITDMVKLIPRSREMTIYVEHDVDTPYIATKPPQDQTSNYSNVFDEILNDVFSQVPVELFSQATYSHPDEVNNEERVGVNDIVIAGEEGHGPYETFIQESGQCTIGFHYEHGTDSDDYDYELYDSENDAAIEDDNLLFDKYVDLPLSGTITRDRVDETILPENLATENLPTEKELPTEELHSPVNSDDEEQSSEMDPEFNASTDMENPSLKIRMRFANREILKKAVKRYSILGGYDIGLKKNDRRRVTALCAKPCPWRLHASQMQNDTTWQIKVLVDEHTCSRVWRNKHFTFKLMAEKYIDRFRDDPRTDAKTLQTVIKREMELEVSLDQCFRARHEALELIRGSIAEQYGKVWEYCEEVIQTNVGSTMKVHANPPFFQRLYVCLDACKRGFKAGCRPVIGVDGCHLKGAFKGQLLAAVGIDANDNMYPIAYAAVEIENKDTWCWFLQILIDDLGPIHEHGWTFISDQQKGLDTAFTTVVPEADHRWCVRHLYGNFKAIHKGKTLKDLLWSAARAPNHVDFEAEMEKLKSIDGEAYNWLVKRDPDRWARSRFSTRVKCDMLLNNLCETFNSWIVAARDKPILTMLEMIRCNLMKRLCAKRTEISKLQRNVCPKIQHKLNREKFASRNYLATYSGNYKFQVGSGLSDLFVVDIANRTCSCRRWELTGIPCLHGCAAIFRNRQDPEDYVDEVYHKATYLKAYEPMIHPLKGCNMWPKCNMDPLLPPLVKKQPGRPKKARKKDPEMEKKVNDKNSDSKQVVSRKGKTIQCHKCWGWGHNQKFCKNEPRDAPQGVYVDKRWAYSRPETGGKKKRQSSGSSAQRSGTSTTVGNEDQVMNQHTTVVQVDVGDVVHSSDGGPAPKKSKLIARRNNPKQALYCDPHEATKVQDNS